MTKMTHDEFVEYIRKLYDEEPEEDENTVILSKDELQELLKQTQTETKNKSK